jgi:geranylgeranyl reductase family protein
MKEHYDAIICGGGPAGSAAALALARSGARVAALDRERFPREKLCGGLLTWKSVRLLERVFGETPDSLAQAGAVVGSADRYAISTLKAPLAGGGLPFPFHFVDRPAFDDLLLKKGVAAGAEFFGGVTVDHVDPLKGVVYTKDGTEMSAEWIVGADGANSVVRRSFRPLDRIRMRRLMAPALEVTLEAGDFPRPVDAPELYVGFLDAGYGWVFPHGGRVVAGICGLRRKRENFRDLFREYLDFLGVDPAGTPEFRGHPLPYGNYVQDPAHGRVLLAGDAGGFVEPLFGEGIFFALCTGWYAGRAVAGALRTGTMPGPVYARRLHRQIIPELRGSDRLRWFLFRAVQLAGTRSLGLFVNSAATPLAEMVHGMRSYRWLRRKRWDFLED